MHIGFIQVSNVIAALIVGIYMQRKNELIQTAHEL